MTPKEMREGGDSGGEGGEYAWGDIRVTKKQVHDSGF